MKASIVIDGIEATFEVVQASEGVHRINLDGAEHEADLVECEPGVYSVLIAGRSFEVALDGAAAVWFGAERRSVELRDPRRWDRGCGSGGDDGPRTLKAAMPGKVVKILAAAGDRVETGQALLVVEAMKMQNEVKSPKDGVVLSLEVGQGDSVAAGQALAVVE